MKKEVEGSNLTKIINEIRGILNDNYFHVNIKLNEKFIGGIEWAVYYKNLKKDDYYSARNRPLLTSKQNAIADIYILRDIFGKLQDKIIDEKGFDLFIDNQKIYYLFREVKEIASLAILNIFTIYTLVNIITGLLSRNILVSCINLAVCIVVGIFMLAINKRLNNLINNKRQISQDILLKIFIKGKGLSFIKEIRNELYKEGIYKYGTNKKTGKTFSKSV